MHRDEPVVFDSGYITLVTGDPAENPGSVLPRQPGSEADLQAAGRRQRRPADGFHSLDLPFSRRACHEGRVYDSGRFRPPVHPQAAPGLDSRTDTRRRVDYMALDRRQPRRPSLNFVDVGEERIPKDGSSKKSRTPGWPTVVVRMKRVAHWEGPLEMHSLGGPLRAEHARGR